MCVSRRIDTWKIVTFRIRIPVLQYQFIKGTFMSHECTRDQYLLNFSADVTFRRRWCPRMTTCAIVWPPSILQLVNAHGHGFCQRANAHGHGFCPSYKNKQQHLLFTLSLSGISSFLLSFFFVVLPEYVVLYQLP